jgi:hypothetical protein
LQQRRLQQKRRLKRRRLQQKRLQLWRQAGATDRVQQGWEQCLLPRSLARNRSLETHRHRKKKEDGEDTATPSKARALRGTAGTFCGRRPPKDPASRAEFDAVRDAYYVLVAKEKKATQKAKVDKSKRKIPPTIKQEDYWTNVSNMISCLKTEQPGLPGPEYVQMACQQLHEDRWATADDGNANAGEGKTGKAAGKAKSKKCQGVKAFKPEAKVKSKAQAKSESKKKDESDKKKPKDESESKKKDEAMNEKNAKPKAKAKAKCKSKKKDEAKDEKEDEAKGEEKDEGKGDEENGQWAAFRQVQVMRKDRPEENIDVEKDDDKEEETDEKEGEKEDMEGEEEEEEQEGEEEVEEEEGADEGAERKMRRMSSKTPPRML